MLEIVVCAGLILLTVTVIVLSMKLNELASIKIDKITEHKKENLLAEKYGTYWKLCKIVNDPSYNKNITINYELSGGHGRAFVTKANEIGCQIENSHKWEFISWRQMELTDPEWCANWADTEKVLIGKDQFESLHHKAANYDAAMAEIEPELETLVQLNNMPNLNEIKL